MIVLIHMTAITAKAFALDLADPGTIRLGIEAAVSATVDIDLDGREVVVRGVAGQELLRIVNGSVIV